MSYMHALGAVLLVVCAMLAWVSYSRRQARLRERAFAALAGPPPPARSTVIQRGSRGPAVLSWKERLREVGYVVPADDVFDAETEAATVSYQQSLGVAADGMVGARTYLRALRPLGWPRHFRHWWRR